MHKANILVVEDHAELREMIVAYLNRNDYQCHGARDTVSGWARLCSQPTDLLLLDWNLPGKSGLQFIHKLRAAHSFASLPIIMLTARVQEDDQIQSLNSGADDFLTKPFSLRLLLARIDNLLKRSKNHNQPLQLGALELEPQERRIRWNKGEQLLITPMAARLLLEFMRNPDQLITRERLMQALTQVSQQVSPRSMDVHMGNLRKQLRSLGLDPITTYYGSGYKFNSEALDQSSTLPASSV